MAYQPHERIWLQCYGDGDPEYDGPVDFDEMYWCQDKVNEHDVGYVRVDALEEAIGLLEYLLPDPNKPSIVDYHAVEVFLAKHGEDKVETVRLSSDSKTQNVEP